MTAPDSDSPENQDPPGSRADGDDVLPSWDPPVGSPTALPSPIAVESERSSRTSWFVLAGLLLLVVPLVAFVFFTPTDDTAAAPGGAAMPAVTDRPVVTTTAPQSAPPSRPGTNSATQTAEAPLTTRTPTTSAPASYEPDLRGYYIVTYELGDYICKESFGTFDDCARYSGGPAPIMIGAADLYCTESYSAYECMPYDPEKYFELGFSGRTYLCESGFSSRYDCVTYGGGPAPSFGFNPDLYCSGSDWAPDCSGLWYPADLAGYEYTQISGRDYLCEDAWSYGDVDCYRYDGGDPDYAVGSFPDLKCSEMGGRLECATDAYPSEFEDLATVRIGGVEYICEDTFEGQECFRWYGTGSPSNVTMGLPDYYCNAYGCDPYGYP